MSGHFRCDTQPALPTSAQLLFSWSPLLHHWPAKPICLSLLLLVMMCTDCQLQSVRADELHHSSPPIVMDQLSWAATTRAAKWEPVSANLIDDGTPTQQQNLHKSAAYISLKAHSENAENPMSPTFESKSELQQPDNTSDSSALDINNSLSSIFTWDVLLTMILPYSLIFVLAVVGNLLVIITLTLNRSMRSVTNIFLLNLAISDLLLGVFCMPATLVGVLLRRFIFGRFMCHLISYMQTVSVAVSVWTLVAMSVERYYAICQPLRSREHRQTRTHAYRILGLVWTLAIFLMLPTAIVSQLQMIKQTGNFKCREAWPSFAYREAFTIFLLLILLVLPLLVMILTYSAIAVTLQRSLHQNTPAYSGFSGSANTKMSKQAETTRNKDDDDDGDAGSATQVNSTTHKETNSKTAASDRSPIRQSPLSSTSSTVSTLSNSTKPTSAIAATSADGTTTTSATTSTPKKAYLRNLLSLSGPKKLCRNSSDGDESCTVVPNSPKVVFFKVRSGGGQPEGGQSVKPGPVSLSRQQQQQQQTLRVNSNFETIQARQRRVVVMLCVVVVEFFLCWTPIFCIDTMALYAPETIYSSSYTLANWIGIDLISACHLICFMSSCTNPITYCFMNQRFRRHFFALFRCKKGTSVDHVTNGTMTVANAASAYFSTATTNRLEREPLTGKMNRDTVVKCTQLTTVSRL